MSVQENDIHLLQEAKNVIYDESEALKLMADKLDVHFLEVVNIIYQTKGRVVVTGIGKSALIGNKLVATFNSTGTPALFMHAADAVHGDLGMIQEEDVVICISNSGNTPEIKLIAPIIKRLGNKLIGLVGNTSSFLSSISDVYLDVSVPFEAGVLNLAPTSSTIAQLAMGDAIAMILLKKRGFTSDDFAKFHPGGNLGKLLYLKVEDVCIQNNKPTSNPNDSLHNVIIEMTSGRLGISVVTNSENEVMGCITDGDLRRLLQANKDINTLKAKDIMNHNPKLVSKDILAKEAFLLMTQNKISQIIVTEGSKYFGVVHIHDLNKEGIFAK